MLRQGGTGAQQRLLDEVRRVELAAQTRGQVDAGEHLQVAAKRLQGFGRARGHRSYLG
jgi:hypothetical protein